MPGADAVAMCQSEASDLPLVLEGSLEYQDPLFRLALVGGKGASSRASSYVGSGCGVIGVEGGLDFLILFGGGGREMVQSSVAGGGCRRECVKLAVQ